MSIVTLEQVKQTLRQTHDEDDDLLQRLIDSAESECLRYLATEELPIVDDLLAPDVANGIILMVQADYDGDPLNREKLREAAQSLWNPYAVQDRFSV
jgi:uncharacterized phage protein (predicted DNA packaging)